MSEQPQSDILTEEQVNDVVQDTPKEPETPKLPSEQQEEELLLGKFKSQDDLVKAYQELEKRLGKPEETTEEQSPKEPEVDEEYLQWKAQKEQEELLKPIGGLDTYNKAIEWAASTMPKEDVEAYNNAIDKAGGDKEVITLLAKMMVDKYNTSVSSGSKPDLDPIHSGERAKNNTAKGYATKSDMLKDIQDPRYDRDPSYRKAVEKKISLTDESNWYSGLPRY